MDAMQFGSVGLIRNPPFGQQQPMVKKWLKNYSFFKTVWFSSDEEHTSFIFFQLSFSYCRCRNRMFRTTLIPLARYLQL